MFDFFYSHSEADHWRPSTAKTKSEWSFTYTPSVSLGIVVLRLHILSRLGRSADTYVITGLL